MTLSGEVRTVEDVPAAFAEVVAAEAPGSIALSGGSTAEHAYAALAARSDVPWSGVDVFFGDERFVSVDHPDSNEGMCRRVLLDAAAPRAIHSLATAGPTAEAAADAYDAELRTFGPLELVHLGLGPDGHTASLFPGNPSLEVRDRLVIATGDALHPHPRLTVTYPALEQAGLIVFTVSGVEKREAFTRVQAGDTSVPAARVSAARIIWLVDPAAGG